jgi:hypothetical protein
VHHVTVDEEGAVETPRFDALLPAEMATRAEAIGVAKAGMDAVSTVALAILVGATYWFVYLRARRL